MSTRFIRTTYFDRQWRKTKANESDFASVKEEILRLGENADKLTARISEVRAAIKGSGKSGGARVFYFAEIKGFVFLLTCYDR